MYVGIAVSIVFHRGRGGVVRDVVRLLEQRASVRGEDDRMEECGDGMAGWEIVCGKDKAHHYIERNVDSTR